MGSLFGVSWGSFLGHSKITSGGVLGHFGAILGSLLGGGQLDSFGAHFEVIVGAIPGPFSGQCSADFRATFFRSISPFPQHPGDYLFVRFWALTRN